MQSLEVQVLHSSIVKADQSTFVSLFLLAADPFPLSFRLQIQASQTRRVSCTFQGSTSVCPSLQAILPPLLLPKLAIWCGSHEVPTTTMSTLLAIWSPTFPIFTEKTSFLLSRIKLALFWVPSSSISSNTLTH